MSDVKHRPTLSAPPSYSLPTPPLKRRKQLWQILASGHMRIISIVLLGTSVFLALHAAFGQLGRPTFHHLDAFPRKIWQSWKVDPLRFEDRDIKRARSWTGLNPSYRYEVLTDSNALPWVELHFGPSGFNRPDIVNTYKALENNLKIIQADFLRYLIMYAEGGVWTDIDVQAIKPVDTFIPKGFDESDVQMIIGIETDEPDFKDHPVLGSKSQSFCQWTFVCKPRLPVMLKLIDNIQIWLAKLANEQGKDISQLYLGFDEVLSGTGPSAFTEAILEQMAKDTRRHVAWDKFHDMTDSILVGGVLVLPAEAFAAGTGHSKSGNHGSRRALVKHHFHASSWTTRHPRKKHPIYGEVERCNWDMECVKLWDANTAFYSSLPEKDQQRMIGIKRLRESQFEEQPSKIGGAQVPMGAAPVEPAKPDGPPDLAAIARFLGQVVEEPAKLEGLLVKTEDQQIPATKPDADEKKDAAIDLEAIARLLGQKVEELPAAPALKADAGVKSGTDEKKDAPIDLVAIARLLGQKVEEAPTKSEHKLVTDAKPPIVDTKPAIDLGAIDATLQQPGVKAEKQEKVKTGAQAAAKKESPLDLGSIKAWIKGSKPEEAVPKAKGPEEKPSAEEDTAGDEEEFEPGLDEDEYEDDEEDMDDEVDVRSGSIDTADIEGGDEANAKPESTSRKGSMLSRLWSS